MLNRRTFLTLASGALADQPSSIGVKEQRRVSQSELNLRVQSHANWLVGDRNGRRAVFSDCDLSGLNFSPNGSALTNLRGADFTEANLKGVTGDNVSFVRASLHGANLSWSVFQRPAFSYASLRNSICEHAVWGAGRNVRSATAPEDLADLQHTDAVGIVLSGARILGLFCEARFGGASLENVDFSYSKFLGEAVFATSFSGANLGGANFDWTVLQAARFNRARLHNATFANADIYAQLRLFLVVDSAMPRTGASTFAAAGPAISASSAVSGHGSKPCNQGRENSSSN